LQFEGSSEIGVFATLTNNYCLVSMGGSENFYSVFEGELADAIPVVHCSVGGNRILGRMCVGKWPMLGVFVVAFHPDICVKATAMRCCCFCSKAATTHSCVCVLFFLSGELGVAAAVFRVY
jgi:hypothetical protein